MAKVLRQAKVGFISLGCPKNLCDTEVMLKKLLDAGYEITDDETKADVVVINTCAFIESAKKESIDNILDIAWLKKNGHLKAIVVTGCLSERYREDVFKEMPEVDCIIGTGSLDKIVSAVDYALKGEKYSSFGSMEDCQLGGDRLVTSDVSAYIKISDGCNNRCAYCSIPDIRGKMRSRTIEDITAEAKELDSMGIKELVVIAQDTSAYGYDLYGKYSLVPLLQSIIDNTKIPWIRLLYCYPDKITDEFVDFIKKNKRIVRYIDIPIQHISDRILSKMNRHGNSQVIRDAVKKLRTIDGMVLRSTAIVGFPGETEDDFTELCDFIKDTKFERFGAFRYSREEGTPAFDMDGQIDEQVKQDRYDILMKEQMEISNRFNISRVGRDYDVIVEGFDQVAESWYGRSYAEAAEIDGKIFFEAPEDAYDPGTFIKVNITEPLDYDLRAEII